MIFAIGGLTRFAENPSDFITKEYEADEKHCLLSYMRAFEPYAVAGKIDDCKTGKELKQSNGGYNDGIIVGQIKIFITLKSIMQP